MRANALLRRYSTPGVLCVATATIAALAATSHGFPVRHVDLNDGGIWVTDNADGLVGRFNKPISQLDGRLQVASVGQYQLDVQQNGDEVVAVDANAGRLYGVNVARPSFVGQGIAVSVSQMALGDSTVAVLSPDNTLRTATITGDGTGVDALGQPRAKGLAANADVAVATDDVVYVVGGAQLRTYQPGSNRPQVSSLHATPSDRLQVATVGTTPVVLDATTKTIFMPAQGTSVSLPRSDSSADVQLQQSSDDSSYVAVATNNALYAVSTVDATVTRLATGLSGTATQPVHIGNCVHAAWNTGAAGRYVSTCDEQPVASSDIQSFNLTSQAPHLVFRVNHGMAVLNDTTDGSVFSADDKLVRTNPQWHTKDVTGGHTNGQSSLSDQQKTPLVAKPVTQGVRPNRTTVVHPLDSDSGPPGHVLEVTQVTKPDQSAVTLTIAPDGQTVLANVATFLRNDAHFQYTISDGTGRTARNTVTLVPRSFSDEAAPKLRDNYKQPVLAVAAGATLTVPVLNDWRDFDGDPLYLQRASSAVGTAGITPNGSLLFAAPKQTSGTTAVIRYAVSDGVAKTPSNGTLKVRVLSSRALTAIPPQAKPDVAQAVVGQPVTLHPLANDIPGADPTDPQARLTISAPVAAVPGANVVTDVQSGTVSFTAHRPASFLLTYNAAYGAARTSQSTIRIDAKTPTKLNPPVALPDIAVVHGQQSAVVDVLANDYDPQGYVLGVQSATSDDPSVQVGVVDGRWLRITSADQPGTSSVVHYVVTDGHQSATGSVSVTVAQPASGSDQVTARDDSVIIRAGDSAAVPALENDSSSAGLPLSYGGAPDTNRSLRGLYASLQGHNVRITAPGKVAGEQQSTVTYVATDSSGAASVGFVHVTVEPAPGRGHPNQPPVPQGLDARETAGDVLVIHVPVYGIDPDGDSTTITGVTSAPKLGRVVSFGPSSISYQSYPTETGTDTFTYQVTDQYGGTGVATVHVGVLPPGPPQPPVAVDDAVNVAPGATVHIDVLANDYVAPGDKAHVVPLPQTNQSVPPGVRLAGSYIFVRAPAHARDPAVTVAYGATDDSAPPSIAHLTVHAVTGARLAPIARDDVATPPAHGADTVTVNVLRNDDDPVGRASDLRITSVPTGVSVNGATLTIPVTKQPRHVPYQVTAPNGLTASAVVDVPGSATSQIRLKPGARITISTGTTKSVSLSSVLTDTAGRALKITTTDASVFNASPANGLALSTRHADGFVLHALGHYSGPGAVTVQVFDGRNLQDPQGHQGTFTIPVQVGRDVPILRCPQTNIPVIEGGVSQSYDIGVLCHVWIDTTNPKTSDPHYTATWTHPVSHVRDELRNGTSLRLTAENGAKPGATGTIRVSPAGSSAGSKFSVTVVKAPQPTARPVVIGGVESGQTVHVDMTQYVTSPLADHQIQVVHVSAPGNAAVSAHGAEVTITPQSGVTHGDITVPVTVTDVPGHSDRQINVTITLTVVGEPDAPGQPTAVAGNHSAVVAWPPAQDNGAPIDHYTVYANDRARECTAQPTCTLTGLQNNTDYDIYVVAHNSVGSSKASPHTHARPDQIPGQVAGLTTKPSDQAIELDWSPLKIDGSPVTRYVTTISPAPSSGSAIRPVGGSQTSITFNGLTNGTNYSFRVQAQNNKGPGPWSSSVTDVPFGKPKDMPAPTATGASVPDPTSTRAITVTWAAADGNGRPVTSYTVTQYSSSSESGSFQPGDKVTVTPGVGGAGTFQQSFTVKNDGTWYEYTVQPTNLAGSGNESARSNPAIQGAAPPDAPGSLSAADHAPNATAGYDGAIHVSFTVPNANSTTLTRVEYGLNGSSTSGSWSSLPAAGSTVEQSITGLTNGTSYVVYVRGCNDAGLCGPWAGPSNQVIPYGPPGAPDVTATAKGRTITYTWSGGGGNGRDIAHYHVCIDNSCTDPTGAGNTAKTYQNYSEQHTVTATVIDKAGQTSQSASASATTVAQPAAPGVSATASGTTITYSWGGGGGNGYPIDHYHVCFDGGSCVDTGAGNTSKQYGGGETHSISAYVVDSLGDQSNTAQASATTANPVVTVSWGGKSGTCPSDPSCSWLNVSWSGFGPGTHQVNADCPQCSGGAFPTKSVSGSSGSLNNYYYVGFCGHSYAVYGYVDSTQSSPIYTNQHGC